MLLQIKKKYIYIYFISPGDENFGKGYQKLNKSLYGLNKSGRLWNILFTNFLKNNNFIQLVSEPCIFKKMEGDKLVCLIWCIRR